MSYTNFTLDIDADGIALVTWDMPGRSMNVFTEEVMDELNAIIDQVAADAAIKGAVITSGKDTFSGGADITMLQKMLTIFAAEKSKDPEKATQGAVRQRRPHDRPVPQAGNLGQAVGVGDQRHLHGRRVRAVARLPWSRRRQFGQGQDGAARSEGRPLPRRRRHPARAAADRPAAGAADADLRPDAFAAEGQGDGPDPRGRSSRASWSRPPRR